jgi:hypothetical protein
VIDGWFVEMSAALTAREHDERYPFSLFANSSERRAPS